MRKLKSERLRLFTSRTPNFHLPLFQFRQPSPSTSLFQFCQNFLQLSSPTVPFSPGSSPTTTSYHLLLFQFLPGFPISNPHFSNFFRPFPNFQLQTVPFSSDFPQLPTSSTSTYPICPGFRVTPTSNWVDCYRKASLFADVGRFGLFCQVFSQGHFHLGARWLTMEDPIERELVVNSIHKYQNTWPESLEAHWWLTAKDRDQVWFLDL